MPPSLCYQRGAPELNGVVERLNRTLRDAFYSGCYVEEYVSQAINERLEEFVRYDNEERCHTASGVPPHFYAQSLKIAA